MIRTAVPVTLRIRGRDGQCVVWLRPMSAREQMVYDRELRRSLSDEEHAHESMLELYLSTVLAQLDRVEIEGDDWPALPDEGRDEWLDALGIDAVLALLEVCVQRLEAEDDRLGKPMSGPRSRLLADSSATSAPTTSEQNGAAESRSVIPLSAPRETLLMRLARSIWRWLTGTGTPSRTGSSSTPAG
jgi:hypothetical protein